VFWRIELRFFFLIIRWLHRMIWTISINLASYWKFTFRIKSVKNLLPTLVRIISFQWFNVHSWRAKLVILLRLFNLLNRNISSKTLYLFIKFFCSFKTWWMTKEIFILMNSMRRKYMGSFKFKSLLIFLYNLDILVFNWILINVRVGPIK